MTQKEKEQQNDKVIKLGSKANSAMKTQQQWQQKYDSEKLEWNRAQIKFDDTMTSILQG